MDSSGSVISSRRGSARTRSARRRAKPRSRRTVACTPSRPSSRSSGPDHHPPGRGGQLDGVVGVGRAHVVEHRLRRLRGEGPLQVVGRVLGEGPVEQLRGPARSWPRSRWGCTATCGGRRSPSRPGPRRRSGAPAPGPPRPAGRRRRRRGTRRRWPRPGRPARPAGRWPRCWSSRPCPRWPPAGRPASRSAAMAAATASTSIRWWSSTGMGCTERRPRPSTAAERAMVL